MSTRGFVGVRKTKQSQIYGHYNHSDSYPTGLGEGIAEAIAGVSPSHITNFFTQRYFVITGLASEQYYHTHISFCEALTSRGDVLLVSDGGDFYKDGLFCEWSYIFNLDEETISVYKGFSKVPVKGLEDWNYENKYFVNFVGEFKYDKFTAELMSQIEMFYNVDSNSDNGIPFFENVTPVKIVRFDYVDREGKRTHRVVKVTNETASTIVGVDLNKKGLRSFLKRKMSNLKSTTI